MIKDDEGIHVFCIEKTNIPVPSLATLTPSKLRITSEGFKTLDSGVVGSFDSRTFMFITYSH